MQRAQGQPRGGRLAALALATLLPAAVAAGTLHAPGASASGSEGPRRDYAGQPTGTVKPLAETGRRRRSGPLRLRLRGRPLAGIPGQSLRLRFSFGRGQRPKRVKLLLRRVGRADPRHARRLGGELVARRVVPVAGRRVRTGLGPLRLEPGPHRLTVRSLARRAAGHRGRRWGSVTVAVAPPAAAATGGGAAASAHPARAEARAALRAVATEQVPQDLSFRPGSEASSAIAVEDDNPDRVIAAANDAGGVPPAFVSNEGLAAGSVRTRQMPALARLPGGGQATLQRCCDPAVAADANGNLWMAIATGGGSGPIALGRIAPASTSFGTMSTALPTAPGSTAQEKPALAVLSDTTIAAAWIETTGGVQNAVYSECDLSGDAADCDEPDAWSPPVPVTAASGLYAMPTLDLSPSGDVYVGWWDAGADNAIELDRCLAAESCGSAAAWDEETPVAALDAFDDDGVGGDDPLPLRCPIIGAPGGLVNPSPSLRVGPDGTVYVAYGDLRDNADPDSPTRCTAAGSDETFDVLVAAGTTPDAFPAADSGVRLSDDGALDLNDHFLAALSVGPSAGEAEATFYTTDADPGGQRARRVYVSTADGGLSWSAPTDIGGAASRFSGPLSDGIDYGDRQGADSAGGVLRPVWTDGRAQQSRDPDLYALTPPVETTIDSGPTGTVANPTATLRFSSAAPRIECREGGHAFAKCSSPRSVGPLSNGIHSFSARATDRAGNVMDPAPPTAWWIVADHNPPQTTLTVRPDHPTRSRRPSFEFVADEPGAHFECAYDGGEWSNCTPPKRAKVTVGRHRFDVRAVDIGGNTDPTPAYDRFKRKRKCSKRDRRKHKC